MRIFTFWISRCFLLALMACVLGSSLAQAELVPPLENYFGKKLTQFRKSVVAFNESSAAKEDSFAFQDIQIWIAPEVEIGVSQILKLTIAPEIDFVLTPQVP